MNFSLKTKFKPTTVPPSWPIICRQARSSFSMMRMKFVAIKAYNARLRCLEKIGIRPLNPTIKNKKSGRCLPFDTTTTTFSDI